MSKLLVKSKDRLGIVERRWRARKIWQSIELPEHILVRNNPDGTPRDEPEEVSLDATRELLERIGNSVFVKNFRSHYVSISADNPSRISYAGGIAHKFDNARRIKTTLQRYVARNYPDEREIMCERGIEMFAEKFKAYALAEFDSLESKFRLVEGQELKNKFREHYGDSSCMTGAEGSTYVAMYRDNPDVCKLLLYNGDDCNARAMVFFTNEGQVVCDRVYPNSGTHIEKFKLYCEERGWELRDFMGYPSSDFDGEWPRVDFDGRSYSITVKVPMRCPDDPHDNRRMMPYMDSFHWGHWVMKNQGMMLCYNHPERWDSDDKYKFDSTSGRINTFSVKSCNCCGTALLDDDYRYERDEYWCYSCFDEEFTECERCNEVCPRDATVTVNIDGGHDEQQEWCECCSTRRAHTCDHCGELFNSLVIQSSSHTDGEEVEGCEECVYEIVNGL
tara:strand:- start:1365 stop:2705 length:1341 start_codon:yes stop_codon:yes gene_type:complete